MKNQSIYLAVVVAMVFQLQSKALHENSGDFVKYQKFSMHSPYEITPESEKGLYDISSLVMGDCDELLKIFDGKGRESEFSNHNVRMSIKYRNRRIWIDENYVVLEKDQVYQLSKENIAKLNVFLYVRIPVRPALADETIDK